MSIPALRACALMLLATCIAVAAPDPDEGAAAHDDEAHHLLLTRVADAPR